MKNFETKKQYFPSFPATSPYVTAVGGTQGPDLGLEKEVRVRVRVRIKGGDCVGVRV
jgi:subtilase family serine protease